jgi:hypothetical protein
MNNTQQQQAQQFAQQQQGGQKTQPAAKPQAPAANDEMAKIAQLGYN